MAHQNRGFEQADADLRAETNAASVGIEHLTDNRGSLSLDLSREENSGVWYELRLNFRGDGTKQYALGTFLVPWQGYPIRTGHGQQLPDRSSITTYFVAMAKDPASPLVNYLTFNLRRQEQPAAGS
jgi:hypothetical protein